MTLIPIDLICLLCFIRTGTMNQVIFPSPTFFALVWRVKALNPSLHIRYMEMGNPLELKVVLGSTVSYLDQTSAARIAPMAFGLSWVGNQRQFIRPNLVNVSKRVHPFQV